MFTDDLRRCLRALVANHQSNIWFKYLQYLGSDTFISKEFLKNVTVPRITYFPAISVR